ncbi:MAG TPA: shikimate dehydrogenase [Anaerolineales bacterium]|nr:shikimate dehydrogenase [Anaerolineales bacterium]
MIHLGLLGYPLEHSLSPKIHWTALRACGLQGDYSLFPVPPDRAQGLEELLGRVRSGEITGLNVTIPYKQTVVRFLDELTPAAKAIGAVNTIYMRAGRLTGDNTDAPGFFADLKHFIGNRELGRERSALVLGAGGSARAVVYALANDGWNITVAARRREQALAFAVQIENAKAVELHPSNFRASDFQLIINATPVGMKPNAGQSLLPEKVFLPPATFVYDLVYNPRETKFVKEARAAGLQATAGLGMLVEQAALAFELWTGYRPSREILFDSVDQ